MFESIWTFLIAWYNLPFTLMLGFSVMLAGLQLLGLSHDSDTDADADTDLDADADMDLDVNHAFGHDFDHDVDHDIEHDVDHDINQGSLSGFSWLAFIGIGKAPLLVVLLILLMSIGFLGWIFNGIAQEIFGFFPSLLLLATGLISIFVGVLITSRITRLIGRALPPVSTTATRAQALVGRPGTVISPFVDSRYGMIHLRDDGGTLISVFATSEDEKPLTRGEEVILLSYDAVQRRYTVTRR
jgi:membrane protein implicated in regulation of membrane protease activity